MKRYILSPDAREDIREIKIYLKREAGKSVADSILSRIKDAIIFLSNSPDAGHQREDLTQASVKFWSVYSYMIVYDPNTRPIEIVRILHGSCELNSILDED